LTRLRELGNRLGQLGPGKCLDPVTDLRVGSGTRDVRMLPDGARRCVGAIIAAARPHLNGNNYNPTQVER